MTLNDDVLVCRTYAVTVRQKEMNPSNICISGCGREVGSKGSPHHPRSCGRTTCDSYAEGFEAGQVAEAKWRVEQALETAKPNEIPPAFGTEPAIGLVIRRRRGQRAETIVDFGPRTKVTEARLQTAVNALVSIHQRAFGIEVPEVEMPMGNRLQRIAAIVETTLTGFSMQEKIE